MNDQLYLCIQASFDDLGRKLLTQGRHTSFERCYCRHGGAVKTGGAGLAIGCSPKWRVQIRDIDAASLATTSCKQDDSHGGEIFIGGTLEAKHHVATLYQISKQPICPEIDFIPKIMVVVPGGHFLH